MLTRQSRTPRREPSAGPPRPPRPTGDGGHHRDARHDLGRVDVHPARGRTTRGPASSRKIAATGAGTVTTTYTPEASDKSTKIVFLQVMRESLDWKVKKPGAIHPSFAYQDADTTSDGFHVDYVSGEKDPYYNGDDAQDPGVQGDAIAKVTATTSDQPTFDDGHFPAGSRLLRWEFRTSAFSAAGADQGRYYGWVDWTYVKEKGKTATTTMGASGTYGPGAHWQKAIALWNTNHGFAMPKLLP